MDLIDALKAVDKSHEDDVLHRLITVWGEKVTSDNVLKEYPRPQFERKSYTNLNGLWDYTFTTSDSFPSSFDGKILVPFSPETILSGVERQLKPDEYLWYKRSLEQISLNEGERVLLHFGAVDQQAVVYVNKKEVASHSGGYLPFTADITDALLSGDDNEIMVCVQDDSDTSYHNRGKQTLKRGGMYYTAQSGIWQTVWLEVVPKAHVTAYRILPDRDLTHVHFEFFTNLSTDVSVQILDCDGTNLVAETEGECKLADKGLYSPSLDAQGASKYVFSCTLTIPKPRLWSPESPYLYKLRITAGDDNISSYFAMRSFTKDFDENGNPVFFLNNKPYFLNGVLDQGYWPDGLYTAPSDEALIFDITEMKNMGFNMLRKHIKVEAERWYYHCDRLGMVVWQDMVSGGSSYAKPVVSYLPTLFPDVFGHMPDGPMNYRMFSRQSAEGRKEWLNEMKETIQHLINVPSISAWVLFNEGWGQFNASAATIIAQNFNDNRLIDQASGWFDENGGDFRSVHNYFRKLEVIKDKKQRAFVISEYGGYACYIQGHSSVDRIYGYKKYDTPRELTAAYKELMYGTIASLREHGLAGAVYTQLSDVEEEVNGILTYDRRHNKLETLSNNRFEEKGDKKVDRYMRSLVMLLAEDSAGKLPLFMKRKKKMVTGYLNDLGLCDRNGNATDLDEAHSFELKDLAKSYIASCLDSKIYGSTLFGMVPMPDKSVGLRIASDIDKITRLVPGLYDLEEVAKPLREAMVSTYKDTLQGGEALWDEYMKSM